MTFPRRNAVVLALVVACAALCLTIGSSLALYPDQFRAWNSSAFALISAAELPTGRRLFSLNCAHCHGEDGRGEDGPSLYDLHLIDWRMHQIMTGGVKGKMPSFTRKLSDAEIHALISHIRTLQD